MKKLIMFISIVLFSIYNLPMSASAYSYGDPGEEKIAEAYKEFKASVEKQDWENAKKIYDSYQKDFDLYFTKVKPDMEKGFEEKDADLLLKSYQAALRLNIERRLHFAQEQFEDYGQAKLLLAKARGTINVLEPIILEKKDQLAVDTLYKAFDDALIALGNPGLFGIGSKPSDRESFDKNIDYIISETKELFPIISELEKDKSHLTEENLGIFGDKDTSDSSIWFYLSMGLILAFVLIIVLQRLRKKKTE